MQPVIVLENLTVRFRRAVAVDSLSLEVPPGKIYGFIGENGAGKTTTIRAMMGLQRPSDGSVRILGEDPLGGNPELLQRIGYVSDDRAMYRWMRVSEIIRFNGALYRNWDAAYAEQLRNEFELDGRQKVKALSRGQLAKLALLCALAPLPEILILDEASSGLDPIVRRAILEKLIDVATSRGTTIFLSSHLIEEVDRIADIVAILCRGKLQTMGEKEAVRKSLKRLVLPGASPDISHVDGILSIKKTDGETQIVIRDQGDERLQQLAQTLGAVPNAFEMTLEDVFAEYTAWGKKS